MTLEDILALPQAVDVHACDVVDEVEVMEVGVGGAPAEGEDAVAVGLEAQWRFGEALCGEGGLEVVVAEVEPQ